MKRGSIAILIILLVAVGAAAISVWYHYANQKLVQEFWGSSAAMLITRAPEVTAMQLGEPGRQMSPDDDEPEPPADSEENETEGAVLTAPKMALEFNQIPWLVVASSDAAKAKGIGNLRRALVLDSTYEWSAPPAEEPKWQYALDMTDDRNFAAVLFDFKTRQVGLAGGRRTLVMNEAAAAEFQKFFDEQLGDEQPGDEARQAEQQPQEAEAKPAPEVPGEQEPKDPEPPGP
jgi:hypothetical protein